MTALRKLFPLQDATKFADEPDAQPWEYPFWCGHDDVYHWRSECQVTAFGRRRRASGPPPEYRPCARCIVLDEVDAEQVAQEIDAHLVSLRTLVVSVPMRALFEVIGDEAMPIVDSLAAKIRRLCDLKGLAYPGGTPPALHTDHWTGGGDGPLRPHDEAGPAQPPWREDVQGPR